MPGQLEVVWFKRNLRVSDHAPLAEACARARATGGHVLGFFAIEPSVIHAPDYSGRHWAATHEALAELRNSLRVLGIPLAVRIGEVVELLERLRTHAAGKGTKLALWSHEETWPNKGSGRYSCSLILKLRGKRGFSISPA